MEDSPLWALDATAMLARYRDGRTTPEAVLAAVLERIAATEPRINALSQRMHELEPMARASTERWRTGSPCGPLDGVPIVIKDNLDLAELPASWGHPALADRPSGDELPVARLRAAGAMPIGKGNCPEFTVEGYSANDTYGVSRNPYDPTLTPGGSSGGVAAAVAVGMAAVGIGTDGGGSIRRPAAYCGLFGLKPGIGHVPRAGGLPQVLLDFEVVGPLARSVRDLRLFDAVLAGPDRHDPVSRARIGTAPKRREPPRVLLVTRFDDAPVEPCIVDATEAFAERLAATGATIDIGPLPLPVRALVDQWSSIAEIGLADLFAREPAIAERAAARYRDMAARGARRPATELFRALENVRRLRAAASQWFADSELILTPAAAAMPWQAEHASPESIAGRPTTPRGHAVFSGWVNAAGLPAIALPAPRPQDSLPIGVQLVGDLGSEHALLDIAATLQPETSIPITPR